MQLGIAEEALRQFSAVVAACVTYQAVYLVIVKVSSIPTFRISSVIGTSRSVEMGTLPEERRHIVLVVQSSSSGTCNGLLSHPL